MVTFVYNSLFFTRTRADCPAPVPLAPLRCPTPLRGAVGARRQTAGLSGAARTGCRAGGARAAYRPQRERLRSRLRDMRRIRRPCRRTARCSSHAASPRCARPGATPGCACRRARAPAVRLAGSKFPESTRRVACTIICSPCAGWRDGSRVAGGHRGRTCSRPGGVVAAPGPRPFQVRGAAPLGPIPGLTFRKAIPD